MTRPVLQWIGLLMGLFMAGFAQAADEQPAGKKQPATGERLAKAQALMELHKKRELDFDPKAGDLYADTAVIRIRRRYPNGEKRDVQINGQQLKELLPGAMPLAKVRGDTNEYRNLQYTIEGEGVLISGERYSNLKKTNNSWSLLVKPDANGKWLIQEEITESQVLGN